MRKITDFIINKRHFILILFIILTIGSAVLSSKVKINHDIAEYLPDTSETRIGMDIMEEEFSETETSTLNLMFENLQNDEKQAIKSEIEAINGVESVDYDETENYNKENYTLYVITVDDKSDSEVASGVYNQIVEKYKDYTIYTSGNISESNKSVLPFWIIALAVFCALIILIIMCESYVEPFLFLTTILMAVVLNKGTNIIFDSVSNITNSIAAILQMALSMDYSIMLMNRYDQEKQTEKDKVKAMKNALYRAFQAISSSSVTTIVGLLALVFMSFKIGKDLGFVLAKGVLFSLVCIFFVLPSLILMFDKWINKTKKKSPSIKLGLLGKASYKVRFISLPLFLGIFIASYILKGNLGIAYTDSQTDKISEIFTENNQMAIIYKNEDEEKIAKCLEELENTDKVNEVLAYGNTINEKLTYDKLNDKLNELGSDVSVEDYLLKIVYYDYYKKDESEKITFSEFIDFIEKEAYNNEKANSKIDDNTKKDITRLKNFITVSAMNKKRTSSDIANILKIDKSKIDDIFVYYLSKNNNTQITLNQFVNFMNKDVLTNAKYAGRVNAESREKLDTLSKFTNKQTLQKKMTSEEMAKLFDIDANTMSDLYNYYVLVSDVDIKMTISEFSNFVLDEVLTDSEYSDSFDAETIQNIKLLATFSNKNTITKNMDSEALSDLFGISEDKIKQILLLKYSKENSKTKLSMVEFIDYANELKDSGYLDGVDTSKLETLNKLSVFAKNANTEMNGEQLKQLFGTFGEGYANYVDMVLLLAGKTEMTPKDFVDFVLDIYEKANSSGKDLSSFGINSETVNNLKLLQSVMDSSKKYTASSLASILGMNAKDINQLYSLIDYISGNTANWKATPNEFVKLILNNSDREDIKDSIDTEAMKQLKLLSTIMTNTINNKRFTYQELSNLIGIDTASTKNIYILYIISKGNTSLSPQEFVNFVLTHKDDSTLSGKISDSTVSDLELVLSVMNGVMENKKYTNYELSSLLGVNKEDMNLLYGLYTSKYVNTNKTLSLKEFVNFLLNDVVTNKEYASNFTSDQITKLNTVNNIMTAAANGTKYTASEIFAIISKLSNDVEKNTISMLYTYYGSSNGYDDTWEMTVEQFVNFLNDDVLQDERFTDFIEDDMRNDIQTAKTTIKDAKELLVGDKYSRIVLNTEFNAESPETFDFIQHVKDITGAEGEEKYVIGDSPMAYDISQTFDDELNLITAITMIAIFIVVAITFKSVIIPVILVLLIQTAVYLTMGILSIVGENVYFISILIVQSILMGATIDYAILYTSYYLEHRKTEGIKEAIIDSYNRSIHTILTSSSILIIVTLIIANFASAIAAKICKTISEGTLCSTILILLLLPAVLAFSDKLIVKKEKK